MTAVSLATGAVPRRRALKLVKCLVVTAILGSVFLAGKVCNAQTFPDAIHFKLTITHTNWLNWTTDVAFPDHYLTRIEPQYMFPDKWSGSKTVGLWRCDTVMQLDTNEPEITWGISTVYYDGVCVGGVVWGVSPIPATNPWVVNPLLNETPYREVTEVLASALGNTSLP